MAPLPQVAEVTTEVLADALAQGTTVVDVREPSEWEQAHLEQAYLIPLGELMSRIDELPQSRPVFLICHVGARSFHAARALCSAGVEAVSVAGGMAAWIDEGKPGVAWGHSIS